MTTAKITKSGEENFAIEFRSDEWADAVDGFGTFEDARDTLRCDKLASVCDYENIDALGLDEEIEIHGEGDEK